MIKSAVTMALRAARLERAAAEGAYFDYQVVYRSLRRRLEERFGADLGAQRVLDFGCGYRAPNVVLLSRDVWEIIGVEVAPLYSEGWQTPLFENLRRLKPGTALEGVLNHAQTSRSYRHLCAAGGLG